MLRLVLEDEGFLLTCQVSRVVGQEVREREPHQEPGWPSVMKDKFPRLRRTLLSHLVAVDACKVPE